MFFLTISKLKKSVIGGIKSFLKGYFMMLRNEPLRHHYFMSRQIIKTKNPTKKLLLVGFLINRIIC